MLVYGTNAQNNSFVQSSLKVNNPIPAIGGSDELNIEEIRHLTSFYFASQNRGVTLPDYYALIQKMDGRYGKPQKLTLALDDNKINVVVVNVDSDGNFNNINTTAIKQNIAEYLSHYRMMNDYINVTNGKIINIAFEIDILVNNQSDRSSIVKNAVEKIYGFFEKNVIDLGLNIYTSDMIEAINNIDGVLNIIKVKVYNKIGNGYSLNKISKNSVDNDGLIDLGVTHSLLTDYNEIFEVKYKNRDIKVNLYY
jgi:hypothetical protein